MAYAQPIPFLDWRPDDDPRRPGVLVDVDGFFPTVKGMMANPSFVPFGAADSGLTEAVTGGISAVLSDGSVVTVVGTARHLWKYNVGSGQFEVWDRVLSGGAVYGGLTNRWRFVVYSPAAGVDFIVAVNGKDVPQVAEGAAVAFQDMAPPFTVDGSTAPVARLVEVVDEGIFLANLATGGNQWMFTPNPRVWAPSVATETVTDYLVGTPGPIMGMHRIRGGIVMYKAASMIFGQFTFPPNYWAFGTISENVGAGDNELIINTGDTHLWVGPDNFYQFDGSSLQPIPNFVKEWFLATVPPADIARMRGEYLRERGIARWYYPQVAGGPLDRTIIYGVRAGQKWLKCDPEWSTGETAAVEAVILPYVVQSASLTYTQFGAQFGPTYNDLPHTTYNDPRFGSVMGQVSGAVLDGHRPAVEVGAPLGGYWVTGEIGDGYTYYQLSRIRPIYADLPAGTTVRVEGYTRRVNGTIDALAGLPAVPTARGALLATGDVNLVQTGVSHTLKFVQVQGGEVTAVALDMAPTGVE